jgi:hypothetical protein
MQAGVRKDENMEHYSNRPRQELLVLGGPPDQHHDALPCRRCGGFE